jgi:hypothetical protein
MSAREEAGVAKAVADATTACRVESDTGLRAFVVRLAPNRELTLFERFHLYFVAFFLFVQSLRLIAGPHRLAHGVALFFLGCFAAFLMHQYLWRRFGDETIRIVGGELTVERRLGGWARVRTYRLDDIEEFRGGKCPGSYWHHMDSAGWRDDLLRAPFKCSGVGFRVAGHRREQRFAVGMRPDEVVRVGKVVAEFAGKPWVDEFIGTPLR